jgi:hypothetical protein
MCAYVELRENENEKRERNKESSSKDTKNYYFLLTLFDGE